MAVTDNGRGSRPRVTVAIPTLNRHQDMAEFTPTLVNQTVKPDEYIVVDAGDPSELPAELEGMLSGSGIPLIYLRSEKGLCLQRNRAIDVATGDIIFFFDDDVELEPTYIEQVLRCFDMPMNPPVGCVQGTLDPAPPTDGVRAMLYRAFGLTHWTSAEDPELYVSGGVRWVTEPETIIEVPVAQGCRMAFRRECFDDERFVQFLPGYNQNEDVDMTYRVSRDWTILQTPHARLNHKESPVNRLQYGAQLEQLIYAQYYFFSRYRNKTPAQVASYAWSSSGLIAFALRNALTPKGPTPTNVLRGIAGGYRRCMRDMVQS